MHCDFDQMLQPEMHDSENGTHSANGAETLVLTANNLVYPEPSSTYYDVININHHHHHLHQNHHNYHHQYHLHNDNHHQHHHHQHLQNNLIEQPNVVEPQYHDITSVAAAATATTTTPTTTTTTTTQALPPTATQISDPQNQNCTDLVEQSNINDLSLFHNQNPNLTEPIVIDNNDDTTATATIPETVYLTSTLQPKNVQQDIEQDAEQEDEDEDEDDDDDDEDDEDNEDDEDEVEDDDDDEGEDDDEVDDEDEADDESEEDDSEAIVDPGQHCQHQAHLNANRSSDIIGDDLIKTDDLKNETDVLDGERMLEVTRKLVRNTERDPDRDLRKQVLLKTAIKKLPHFMDYSRYSDSLDRSFHTNISPQAYYEHHDSQPKFYNSVQPNAIQMSTTGLRMLDLNDDHDPELINIDQNHSNPNLAYHNNSNNNNNININRTTSLEHHDYLGHHQHQHHHQQHHQENQYDRYHQRTQHELNHYETSNAPLLRHNSLDNLYQPINGNSDMNEVDVKDVGNGDERIPLAFQITCEIYDFTCTSEDNEKKLLDNLTDGYFTTTKSTTQESRTNNSPDEDDCNGDDDADDSRDPDGSDTSSSSHSSISTSDDSANSLVSQSNESDEANGSSLLEASLNSSSDFYHSSHDSGVALFPSSKKSNNKRSSSSIGLDDEMEIDHLTELSSRSSSFGSNNQYKKLRKREIIE